MLIVALGSGRAPAEPPSVESLQAENARLRARIIELEKENAHLRGTASQGLAAALAAVSDGKVETKIDAAHDTTTITLAPSRLVRTKGGTTRDWLTLRAEHPGRTRTMPVTDVMLVVQTSASAGTYRDAKTLELMVDGAREQCAVVGYETEPITAGRAAGRAAERETVRVKVPDAVLGHIAEARQVRGTLGPTEFELTPEQLSGFRAFRRRVDGAGPP
jgi:hypothetical protein